MRQPFGLLLCALLVAPPLGAIEALNLQLDTLGGAGWQASDISLQLDTPDADRASLRMRIGRLDLPPPLGTINNLQLECALLQLRDEELSCAQANLRLASDLLDRASSTLAFSYRPADGAITLSVRDLRLAGGSIGFTAHSDAAQWAIDYRLAGIDLARLPPALLQQAGLASAGGKADATGRISAAAGSPAAFKIEADLRALAFATPDGGSAGEALNARGSASGEWRDQTWRVQSALTLHDGTLCITNCWELAADPLHIETGFDWSGNTRQLNVARLDFRQASLGTGAATLRLSFRESPTLDAFTLQLAAQHGERLYTTYLQPLLIGTALEALDVHGGITADIDYQAAASSSARIALDAVSLEDRDGRFGITGLDGDIAWRGDSVPQQSTLRWEAAHVYQLSLGAADVQAQSQGQSVRLLQAVRLPILDGQLEIEQFAWRREPGKSATWNFDGLLKPVSMQAFSAALGWPEMHGKLSGMIPDVRYADGELSVGGMLLIRAFDGAITLRDLRIERLFDVAPSLRADIKLDNLDLDALTRAFSFGNIQGRFSGQVDNLQLIDWRPVAFGARFATPADDTSRHRISQRAVENISQIGGGGIGGTLSRSFLRVFDEFAYDRIGISCVLQNGVCAMDGVAPAQAGYYLVKGGGLPRIDIIGYSHRVDWDTLLERIGSITSAAPVVR